MATVYKVLGQLLPAADTLSTAYTVPANSSAVVSTIVVANLGSAPTSFRIAVRPGGATIENKHYVAYDISIASLDSITLTLGLTVTATDVISVESNSGLVSFNIFGSELSNA
jgi:glucose-6-phosphate dehydrogenase assembly protein OpcA